MERSIYILYMLYNITVKYMIYHINGNHMGDTKKTLGHCYSQLKTQTTKKL